MISLLGNSRRPDIVFMSSGRIDISARVAKRLHLQRGDAIDILQEGLEYYLYVKHHASGNPDARFEATAFPSNSRGSHFRATSVRLCNAVLRKCGTAAKARLSVGLPVQHPAYGILLPVITKNPL